MSILHDVFIAMHAFGGMLALVGGIYAVLPKRSWTQRFWLFRTFAAGLTVMIAALAAAIAVDFPALGVAARIVFPALFALALYIAHRGRVAGALLRRDPEGRDGRFQAKMDFGLITLLAAFITVAAVELRAPWWLLPPVAAGAFFGGKRALAALGKQASGDGITKPPAGKR